jgi:hypothetical protein
VQPIAVLQPHPAQHKTPKNREERTQTKINEKEINLARASFLLLYNFRFPSGATGVFRSRAQRRTNNNDETPEEKTGFVTKIQNAAASGFVTFSKWVLRKCEEQDTD